MSNLAVHPSTGYAPLAGRSLIEITGADRVGLLHNFCTNDIKKLAVGTGCEAFITSPQGKTFGYVLVFAHEQNLWLDTAAGQAQKLITHLERYVISERVEFRDQTELITDILVLGDLAAEKLGTLLGASLPQSMLGWTASEIQGVSTIIRQVPWGTQPSFFWQIPANSWGIIEQALQSVGVPRLTAEAIEAARILSHFPAYGSDVTDDNLPQEIDREPQTISFKKGCYLGQETVARLDALGHVNRLLVRLRITNHDGSHTAPQAGTELMLAEKVVGKITSAAYSESTQQIVALALVKRSAAPAGTKLLLPAGEAEVMPKLAAAEK